MTTKYFENSLKIKKQDFLSIYKNSSILYEYVDENLIISFLKNNNGIEYSDKHPQQKYFITEQQQIQNYYDKRWNKKIECFKIKLNIPSHKWGRIQVKDHLSLSVFHRPTRHSFCFNKYIDIDIVNASQSILYNIFKQYKIIFPFLEQYCFNRDNLMLDIMNYHNCTKDQVKKLFISLTFGGSYSKWLKDNNIEIPFQFLTELNKEYSTMIDLIWEHNSHIVADILKDNPSRFDKCCLLIQKKRSYVHLS